MNNSLESTASAWFFSCKHDAIGLHGLWACAQKHENLEIHFIIAKVQRRKCLSVVETPITIVGPSLKEREEGQASAFTSVSFAAVYS